MANKNDFVIKNQTFRNLTFSLSLDKQTKKILVDLEKSFKDSVKILNSKLEEIKTEKEESFPTDKIEEITNEISLLQDNVEELFSVIEETNIEQKKEIQNISSKKEEINFNKFSSEDFKGLTTFFNSFQNIKQISKDIETFFTKPNQWVDVIFKNKKFTEMADILTTFQENFSKDFNVFSKTKQLLDKLNINKLMNKTSFDKLIKESLDKKDKFIINLLLNIFNFIKVIHDNILLLGEKLDLSLNRTKENDYFNKNKKEEETKEENITSGIMKEINKIKSFFSKIFTFFKTMFLKIKVWISEVIVAPIVGAIGALGAPFWAIVGAIVLIVIIIIIYWNEFKSIFASIWESIQSVFSSIGEVLKEILRVVFSLIDQIMKPIANFIKSLVPIIKAILFILKPILSIMINTIVKPLKLLTLLITTIVEIFKALFKGDFKKIGQILINYFKKLFNIIFGDIINYFKKVFDFIKGLFGKIIQGLFGGIKILFTNFISEIKNSFSQIGIFVKELFLKIVKSISIKINSLINAIVNLGKNLFNKIKDSIIKILNKIPVIGDMFKTKEETEENTTTTIKKENKIESKNENVENIKGTETIIKTNTTNTLKKNTQIVNPLLDIVSQKLTEFTNVNDKILQVLVSLLKKDMGININEQEINTQLTEIDKYFNTSPVITKESIEEKTETEEEKELEDVTIYGTEKGYFNPANLNKIDIITLGEEKGYEI